MKYLLKKDLPFAKAGAIVSVEKGAPITFIDKRNVEYACNYLGEKKLIEDGWIEEAKPREWWVLEKQNSISIYEDKEMAEHLRNPQSNLIIKVREVL